MTYIKTISFVTRNDNNPPFVDTVAGERIILKDLNSGAGGKYIYLKYVRSAVPDEALRAINVVAGSNSSFTRGPSYFDQNGTQDLSEGAGGKYIYLIAASKSSTTDNKTAITDIDVIIGNKPYTYPKNEWVRINQDCNQDAGGNYVYICYKEQLL